jgi:VanZ family protein
VSRAAPPESPLARPDARPRQQLWRAAFVLYALVLAAGTHWPKLKLDVAPIERADLIQHLIGFSIWTALLIAAGFFGPWNSWRNIAAAHLVAVVYAGIDEGTQLIPVLGRTAAWDDFAFNCIGVWAGAAIMLAVRARALTRGERRLDL